MLVIYDNTGTIYFCGTGFPEPDGLQHMYVEIPEGKYLKCIDTTQEPHQPVFEDMPKSDMELLKERVETLEQKNEAIETGIEAALGGI